MAVLPKPLLHLVAQLWHLLPGCVTDLIYECSQKALNNKNIVKTRLSQYALVSMVKKQKKVLQITFQKKLR